jgi:hypothetical protein
MEQGQAWLYDGVRQKLLGTGGCFAYLVYRPADIEAQQGSVRVPMSGSHRILVRFAETNESLGGC